MAEPRPNIPETPQNPPLVIGETQLYLAQPAMINGQETTSLTILGAGKRAADGIGSAVPLVREMSRKKGEEGVMVDKPLTNLNDFDEVPWDKISGIQWTDAEGITHIITKDELQLTPPAVAPPEAEQSAGATPESPADAVPSERASEPVPSESPSANVVLPENVHAGPPEEMPESSVESVQPPEAGESGAESHPEAEFPEEAAPAVPTPSKEARTVLEALTEDPNTITIVGLKAYETRALDLADRSMQKLGVPKLAERVNAQNTLWERVGKNLSSIEHFAKNVMWKQSVGGIYFHEKARQYYLDMLKASETPFAEDAIRMAERRATDRYNAKLADSNFLVRAGTRVVEGLRDLTGMRTAVQQMALEEIGMMKTRGEIAGMETLEREARALRARFGQDIDQASRFVREQLGEKLEILEPENEEHKPLVEGIQNLLKQYASGEIADKAEFDGKAKEFFAATLKNVRPDIFAEAELYSSSLFDVAETLRMKMSHEAGLANIDEAIAGMQIRLGLGQMGEVTSLEPTAVEKGVGRVREVFEWLNRKNVIVPMVFNEVTIGSAVALVLSASRFVSTVPARAIAGIGGGALAGGLFAGWREYGQLQRDYLTHLRERESGANFTEMQKKRAWFERFAPKQRSASEMITTIRESVYEPAPEGGQPVLKATLTDDELRTAFATIADTQSRKAVSETGPKRIGLIRYTSREAIESERAALDITAGRALGDLETYLASHEDQAAIVLGENTFSDFMVKLTSGQTHVLREGVGMLEQMDDEVRGTLNLIADYAPEAGIVKRRWPFASRQLTADEKAMGMDAILEEFNKEARVEAVKYGAKAGIVGAAVGTVIHGIAQLGHLEATTDTIRASTTTVDLPPPDAAHTVSIGGQSYQVPPQLVITPHDGVYDAKLDLPGIVNFVGQEDVTFGTNMTEAQLRQTLENAGLSIAEPHRAGEALSDIHSVVDIKNLTNPDGVPLTAKVPEGFDLRYDAANHNWQLLDTDKNVVTALRFTDTGDIAGSPAQITQLQQDMLNNHGLQLERFGHDVTIPESGGAPLPGPEVAPVGSGEMIDLRSEQLPEGGLWDHFLRQSSGDHPMATTNGVKNMFRLYEQYEVPHTADGLPTNIVDSDGAVVGSLRDATYGTTPVREFDIARIPNDAHINVPKELFGADAIREFSQLNDRAIDHFQELVASGKNPMEALRFLENSTNKNDQIDAVLLRLGYFGRDADLPTEAQLKPLLETLGLPAEGSAPSPISAPVTPEHTVRVTEIELTRVFPRDEAGSIFAAAPIEVPNMETVTTITRDTLPDRLPWLPIFIPVREGLEPVMPTGELAATRPGDVMYSPFGYEESFLNREQADGRKSPRLTENPDAKLAQSEEISWYLSTLTPEEHTLTDTLLAQAETPINPEVRTVVTMPVSQAGGSVYQRLASYADQTDRDGNPLNPKQTEFVVYDVLTGDMQPDATKAEVDRFRAEHPDMSVTYLTHTYPDQPANGRVKRDLTNAVLTRIATLPEDAPDVVILSDNGTGTPLSPTYLASVTETLDRQPDMDIVAGTVTLPPEAYRDYPMLFAQHRAFELFDALARHGDVDGTPAVFSGNMGLRAGTLAAIGGYNENAVHLDERELAWMTKNARKHDVSVHSPDMAVTIDPREVAYKHLQVLGLAEPTATLSNNEVYKDMSWQDMAQKATEAYTKERLEQDLTAMYESLYPTLKTANPARFDAYFSRTMDTLGITYELQDGKIILTDTANLAANMEAQIDTESFAKSAAEEVVASTPYTPESSRDVLEQMAGTQEPVTPEEPGIPGEQSARIAAELPAEAPQEQEVPHSDETTQPEVPASGEAAAEPVAAEQPSATEPLPAELPTEAVEPTRPEQAEAIPEGVEERINYVLEKSEGLGARVQVTPGEFMDYLKSNMDIAGSRITGGTITVDDGAVKLTDMKAKTPLGEAQFEGELVNDPSLGLVVKRDSVHLKLPLLARLSEGPIRNSLTNLHTVILDHVSSRINPDWKANRIDLVGETLEVRFSKKPQQ